MIHSDLHFGQRLGFLTLLLSSKANPHFLHCAGFCNNFFGFIEYFICFKSSKISNNSTLNSFASCCADFSSLLIISINCSRLVILSCYQKTPKLFFHILLCLGRKFLHGLRFQQSKVLYFYLHCAIYVLH